MLADTITTPDAALSEIACFAIVEYAKHCRPDDPTEALIQAAYVKSQRPGELLPVAVERVMCREDIDELAATVPEYFGGTGDGSAFIDNATESINMDGITLDADEAESLLRWVSVCRSASYFNRVVNNHEGIERSHARTWKRCKKHASQFGPMVWCSVPADFAFEVIDGKKDLAMFRAVAACRSIIGRHRYTGTTKAMIRCRMIGAKSQAAADALCKTSDTIRDEFDRLGRRRQFDNLLTDAACRGFITKVGMARRIYLSTTATSPDELAKMVVEAKRRRRYLEAEKQARRAMTK